MIVEPIAGDAAKDNMNPVGRLYYNASTMICVPTSLDQEVAEGLEPRPVAKVVGNSSLRRLLQGQTSHRRAVQYSSGGEGLRGC